MVTHKEAYESLDKLLDYCQDVACDNCIFYSQKSEGCLIRLDYYIFKGEIELNLKRLDGEEK